MLEKVDIKCGVKKYPKDDGKILCVSSDRIDEITELFKMPRMFIFLLVMR